MEELYLIRHGNADYFKDCLTEKGREQVESLSKTLEQILPDDSSCSLVSSPSGRAIETAEGLIPLVKNRTGKDIKIYHEPALCELITWGYTEEVMHAAEENMHLLEKYSDNDYGIFVSHEEIIAPMSIILAESSGIVLPENLKPDYMVDESGILDIMNESNSTRDEALEILKKLGFDKPIGFKRIAEASAIHFNLKEKTVDYIIPQ